MRHNVCLSDHQPGQGLAREELRAASVQRPIHRFGTFDAVTLANLAAVIRTFLEV